MNTTRWALMLLALMIGHDQAYAQIALAAQDSQDLKEQSALSIQDNHIENELLDYQAPELHELNGPIEPYARTRRRKRKPHYGPRMAAFVEDVASDIFWLNCNLFLWNSFKVIATTFPLFTAARMFDEKIQNCFYDRPNHKNLNPMPDWCHDVAKVSIALPIVALGLKGLISSDPRERYTAQLLIFGTPIVIWTKTLIKKAKFQACLRPWNEKFSCEKRAFGGFPSGHMAQALYSTVLYGMQYGPKYGIPLGILATFLGVTFVTCNRHYLSQIIGGAGFGTMYGLAANTLVNRKLTEKVKLGFKMDEQGAPTVSLAFKF